MIKKYTIAIKMNNQLLRNIELAMFGTLNGLELHIHNYRQLRKIFNTNLLAKLMFQ